MIKSIVRSYNWTPETISNLYLDDADHKGIVFWYYDVLKVKEELNKK